MQDEDCDKSMYEEECDMSDLMKELNQYNN